ncbi:MAG: YceI family protein [Deltaproteobacteria bacterium]|jgi:polyisoprenoid-binding protein YceI|nr:YceI family protein [Deltaproteobacteria bacterium]MCW8892361.1 YceI family protein [Deltaproteobacteria bacterium]
MLKKLSLILFSLLFIANAATAETFQVDTAHTQIHFSVQHLVVFKVRGNFNDFTGTITADPKTRTIMAAEATIKTASIDTRNEKRDKHLRSPDFFDTAKYPEIMFKSKKVTGSGDNITLVGDLTMKDVTREVVLTGSFLGTTKGPMGNLRAGFEASGEINRKDFGLNWNKVTETGGLVVGDEITIGLEIESIIKAEK